MVSSFQRSSYPAVEEVTRTEFLSRLSRDWQQGEHLSIWGGTGSGKTTVCAGIVNLRQYSAVLASKQEDKTLKLYEGYKVLKQWRDRRWFEQHVIVWPYARYGDDVDAVFRKASLDMMDDIYWEKRWTFQLDDAKMLRHLGLMGKVKTLFAHCRSQKSSLIFNDVRPFETVQEALDQTSYKLSFYMEDKRDVYRLAESAGKDPKRLMAYNNQLRQFEFLFLPKWGDPIIVRN
jgi:ABC-type oligopeptide transport system ATPase subunit